MGFRVLSSGVLRVQFIHIYTYCSNHSADITTDKGSERLSELSTFKSISAAFFNNVSDELEAGSMMTSGIRRLLASSDLTVLIDSYSSLPPFNMGQNVMNQWKNNTHCQWWRDPGLRKNVFSVMLLYFAK